MNGITYDGSRKLNTLGRNVGINSTNKDFANYVYNPVPYNISFTLYIMVKNAEDGTKILEQILPYFTPEWTTTVRIIDDPEIVLDVPVILNGINSTDNWEGSFEERRYLIWTLQFTLKGQLFGPVKKDKIIKVSKSNVLFDPFDKNGPLSNTYSTLDVAETITTYPGLTANGTPTSNSELTVPYSQIDWEDDYGFVTEIEK